MQNCSFRTTMDEEILTLAFMRNTDLFITIFFKLWHCRTSAQKFRTYFILYIWWCCWSIKSEFVAKITKQIMKLTKFHFSGPGAQNQDFFGTLVRIRTTSGIPDLSWSHPINSSPALPQPAEPYSTPCSPSFEITIAAPSHTVFSQQLPDGLACSPNLMFTHSFQSFRDYFTDAVFFFSCVFVFTRAITSHSLLHLGCSAVTLLPTPAACHGPEPTGRRGIEGFWPEACFLLPSFPVYTCLLHILCVV